MMLMGAVTGFWAVQTFDAPSQLVLAAAVLVSALVGAGMALIHAFLVITMRANQIVSGLALTIFAGAAGLASYLGNDLELTGDPAEHSFAPLDLFGLGDLPVLGPIVFDQNALVYLSWLSVLCIGLYLARTRTGLNVRAVGEAPASADAMGINVSAYRYSHTLVGGAFAGVAGACFSLAIIGQWQTSLTGGAGWIAIALVIFAFWRADLCLAGAYAFGAFSALPLILQGRGWLTGVPSEVFSALPYVMTIVVLVLVSTSFAKRRLGAPAALGVPYVREER
jgi:simple sugar transport system permease protein